MTAAVGHRAGSSRLLRPSRALPALRGRERGLLVAGAAILTAEVVAALAAPLIGHHSPSAINPAAALAGPSAAHWFGTDELGRDVFARVVFSARIDLLLAFGLVSTAFVVGTALGVVAGWFEGWFDLVLTRVIDVALAFPFLVLVISVIGMRGPGLLSLYIAVSLVAWVFYARLVREEVRRVKRLDYMVAAGTSGFGTGRVLVRHLIPNVVVQPLVYASSDCVYALILGASVSYLGLGVQPPRSEWGQMVAEGTTFLASHQWWMSVFPGVAIVVTGVAFSLVADGLADRTRSGRRA